MTPTRHPRPAELIAIAAVLMATISLSIDVMLPALGDMAVELGAAEANQRQLVIIVLFLGLAAGQLVFGPLSDSIGRRPSITLGAALFAVGSVICAMAQTFDILILGRFVQGLGAAGPRIATVALIRDRFEGAAMARVMSIIMGIFIMVPILGPSVGQALLLVISWRGMFGLLAVTCLLGAVWLLLRQPETLVTRRKISPRQLLSASAEVFRDARAIAFTVAGGLCYGALMGYINPSQQLFQDVYKVGDLYAVLFGGAAVFISAATLTNARLVKRIPMDRVCVTAMALLIALALSVLGFMALTPGLPPLWVFMVFNCPALFLMGLTFGNFNAIALERLGHIAGLAAAVTASLQTLVGVVVAGIIGLSFDQSLYPIFIGYALCGAAALMLMRLPAAQRPPALSGAAP